MTKLVPVVVFLMVGCGGSGGPAGVAPEGGAGASGGIAGAAQDASGAAGTTGQAGAAAGEGGAGTTGAAGSAAGTGGATGGAGADGGAAGTGEARPWCLDPLPADVPPDCADSSVAGATSSPTTYACAGSPTKTVKIFGSLACRICMTSKGHALDGCLAFWIGTPSQQYMGKSYSCGAPTVFCVASCTECP